jgi:lipopolysaccharide assembly protein A
MQFFIIIALVIAVVAVVFALQNITIVTVTFLLWSYHGSLALVLLLSVAAGVLISLLFSLPGEIRGKMTNNGQKKKLGLLQSELDENKQRAEKAENEVKGLEEQLATYSAALEEKHQNQSTDKPTV